jgi:hypothetical protein
MTTTVATSSPSKPVLVVCGATGNQGGSIIRHFAAKSPCPYTLRGLTRNTYSARSRTLEAQGVEMVHASYEDPASLEVAFRGASIIYGATDFWAFYDAEFAASSGKDDNSNNNDATEKSVMERSMANDRQQNINIIDAAVKVPGLQRFIHSSMPHVKKLSGGEFPGCYHFDGKGQAEAYGATQYPEFWKEKTSVLFVGLYLENQVEDVGALFRPKLVCSLFLTPPSHRYQGTDMNTYTLRETGKQTSDGSSLVLRLGDAMSSINFPMTSVTDDVGAYVDALIRAAPCTKLIGVRAWLDLRDYAQHIADALHKPIEFIGEDPDFANGLFADDRARMDDNMQMIFFSAKFGYDGHLSAEGRDVVRPEDLGVELVELRPVEEWFAKQDWMSILDTMQ